MPEQFQEIIRGDGFVILNLNTPKPQSSGDQTLEQPQTKNDSDHSSSPTLLTSSVAWTPEELASVRQNQANYLAFRQQQQEREQTAQGDGDLSSQPRIRSIAPRQHRHKQLIHPQRMKKTTRLKVNYL